MPQAVGDSVAEQVDEDLTDTLFIRPDKRRNLTLRLVTEFESLVAGLQLEHANNLHEIPKIQRLHVQGQFAALDARDVRVPQSPQQMVTHCAG